MNTIQAHCDICNKTVAALVMVAPGELKAALNRDAEVRVMHVSDTGDHIWNLTDQQKANMQKVIAVEGRLP